MKPLQILQFSALFSMVLLVGCGGGAQQNPPPNLAPLSPQGGALGADPAGGPGGAPPPPRLIQAGEFSLSLEADERISQVPVVEVHVISADTETATRIESGGSLKYWESPLSGPTVRPLSFGRKGGRIHSVQVPSVPAKNSIVLAADLAQPSGGNDFRILKVPLELDYTDPAKPVARPLRVMLTPNGWQRMN